MLQKLWYTAVAAPFGNLYVTGNDDTIVYIGLQKPAVTCSVCDNIPLIQRTVRAIEQYLSGNNRPLPLPKHRPLSPFQRNVFDIVYHISYSETMTYTDIACRLGKPDAVRAVMHTCISNPLWIVIPTHRAVPSKDFSAVNDRCWDAASVLRSLEQRYLCES